MYGFHFQFVALEAARHQLVVLKVLATATDVEHPMGGQRTVLDEAMDYIKVGWKKLSAGWRKLSAGNNSIFLIAEG